MSAPQMLLIGILIDHNRVISGGPPVGTYTPVQALLRKEIDDIDSPARIPKSNYSFQTPNRQKLLMIDKYRS